MPCATPKMELILTKIGNSWKLLLTVIKESFASGLLDQTLKHIM